MYRKKEIIIIIGIILLTVIFALYDDTFKNNEDLINEHTPSYVTVRLEGEVKEEHEILIPYGYTYGYVMKYASVYLNDYSYYELQLDKQIFEDTTITILSNDKNNNYKECSVNIAINTATLDELLTLYGIGEARAKKIIEYRENNRIDTFEELKDILGISNEVLERIKTQAIL